MPQPVYKHAAPINQKINRAYNRAVRKYQEWCEEHHLSLKTWSEADSYDICVISKSEYDVGEYRKKVVADNQSYFMEEDSYDQMEREADEIW